VRYQAWQVQNTSLMIAGGRTFYASPMKTQESDTKTAGDC